VPECPTAEVEVSKLELLSSAKQVFSSAKQELRTGKDRICPRNVVSAMLFLRALADAGVSVAEEVLVAADLR
jgi:hypothetical protein